ncbi:hypothetical protein [Microbacterium dauci]|uniref:Lipoprotein n=1 Tax=Microbacterium dauci TaxID=3048008 RepID=A0ABT6ZCR4_9MICO|nr:hypothetical protein [Microbacterium sp. LX3-4]MDJ1113944.1 hypothetical protein [Microbacterium sp. LX3-4]
MHHRLAAIALLGAASLLTGCIATDGFAPSEPTDVASASPTEESPAPEEATPSPEELLDLDLGPYAVPEVDDDEVARVALRPDGSETVAHLQVFHPVEPDVDYVIEFDCRPAASGARLGITWQTVDGEGQIDPYTEGTQLDACQGPSTIVGFVYANREQMQLTFTTYDGVADAWARFVPVR